MKKSKYFKKKCKIYFYKCEFFSMWIKCVTYPIYGLPNFQKIEFKIQQDRSGMWTTGMWTFNQFCPWWNRCPTWVIIPELSVLLIVKYTIVLPSSSFFMEKSTPLPNTWQRESEDRNFRIFNNYRNYFKIELHRQWILTLNLKQEFSFTFVLLPWNFF